MITERICARCGAPFQVQHWLKKRHCGQYCALHASKNKRHGLTHSTENAIWRQMKQRCYNPRKSDYGMYGAKGIRICDRWFNSFENFYSDMGPRPSMNHTVDRIDGAKDYSPDNCRWATKLEQNRNRRGVSTQADDDKIRDGIASGLNFKQIATLMGKSHGSITARAYYIGLRSGQPCGNLRSRSPARASSQLSSPNCRSEL